MILVGRDAESFSESHDEVGTIGKAAIQAGTLHRLPRAQQIFCFGKTFCLNIIGWCGLEILTKASTDRAFGKIKGIADVRHVAGWFGIML